MRTATLVIDISSAEEVTLPLDEYTGMFVDALGSSLIITYIDSVTYRRLLVLLLSSVLKEGGFKVVRRYVQGGSRGRFYVNGDDSFNHSIEQQILWGIKNPARRDAELRTVRELIKFDDEREEG